MIKLLLIAILIVFLYFVYRKALRHFEHNTAVERIEDLHHQLEIKEINKIADDLASELKKKQGETNE